MEHAHQGNVEEDACVSDTNTSRNAAACHDAQGPSSSEIKRSEAAQLARELASSSSWSDTFVPTTTNSSFPQRQAAMLGSRVGLHSSSNSMRRTEYSPGPPPAYSTEPDVHELPATPVMVPAGPPADTERTRISITDDDEQNAAASEPENDEQAPLLTPPKRRPSQRGWTPWIHKGKTTRHRYCRLISLVIAFSLLASFLICAFVRGPKLHSAPVRPVTSFVPTGPDYELHETTRNIHGTYKLYDRLELTTTTGSIDIEIQPQPGETPAVLILSSHAGSITLRLSSEYVHRKNKVARTIFTEIRSFTGAVFADILLGHGGYALVDTITGSQVLSVMTLGVGFHDDVSNLTTVSKTGVQKVTVTSLDASPITNMQGMHRSSATASLDIIYPDLWFGQVHAMSSGVGQVEVEGAGLEYTKRETRDVIAHRGSPRRFKRVVDVISEGTGSVSFRC